MPLDTLLPPLSVGPRIVHDDQCMWICAEVRNTDLPLRSGRQRAQSLCGASAKTCSEPEFSLRNPEGQSCGCKDSRIKIQFIELDINNSSSQDSKISNLNTNYRIYY